MRSLRARTSSSRARSRSVTSTEERLVAGATQWGGILLLKECQDRDPCGVDGNRLGLDPDEARRAAGAAVGEQHHPAPGAAAAGAERGGGLLGRGPGRGGERGPGA